ncbi:MAG: NADP-dependent malic enzyme [Candidatus Bathyarchaeota archaeon]|nr:MAG: NADP-dependent malic enzyme [Candidatus Bathyarchaeota archaeon]
MTEKRVTVEELLEKAKRPSKLALAYHSFYEGKVQVMPKCAIRSPADFAIWYTPGVAASCRKIKESPSEVWAQTNRSNYVAVVSDGTRVLGLGDIGAEAGMPVMEGKALLFKYLGGVDAFPICLNTKDPEEIVHVCELIQPTFGGINLEDISKPKCFYVLDKAREKLSIPVWHDDQQGTATVILAGLINALKLVGKKPSESIVTLVGVGAANTRTAYVLLRAGFKAGNLVLLDTKGILHAGRPDVEGLKEKNPWKYELAQKTNAESRTGDIVESLKGADAVVAASRPGPGTIRKEWISHMATDSIVFACANPVPEIWPWEAKEAGARIVGTGRSDFPNQINNSLGFPAIFRGVLDVKATTVTDDMCVAAANELARFAEERGIDENDIAPRMDEWEVFPREAVACALQSIKEGVARIKPSKQELWERAVAIIKNARASTSILMKQGLIRQPPPEDEVLSRMP